MERERSDPLPFDHLGRDSGDHLAGRFRATLRTSSTQHDILPRRQQNRRARAVNLHLPLFI
jgi:hypothetical protein